MCANTGELPMGEQMQVENLVCSCWTYSKAAGGACNYGSLQGTNYNYGNLWSMITYVLSRFLLLLLTL